MRSMGSGVAAALLLATVSWCDEPGNSEPGAWVERNPGAPTIVFLPQHSVPMFSCTVLVPAGSALETATSNGAAHFLEHLLFNGTTSRSREQIYARGDLLGAYNNASTQQERTVFQMLLPSEKWREGLELQADMLRNSTLPGAAFEKEKGIILEELAKDQTDPSYAASQWEQAALWGGDSRALPVLGTRASISAMDPGAVAAFYRERYLPAGMTIVVMGDFDAKDARAEVLRHYGSGGAAPLPLPARPDFPTGRLLRAHNAPDLETTQLRVLLPLPALEGADHAGARLLCGWLESGERSALHRAVEAAGVSAPDVSASVDAGQPWSLLVVAAQLPAETTDAQAAKIVDAILAHLAALDVHGVDGADRGSVRQSFLSEELSLRERMHYYALMHADVLAADPEAALRIADDLESAEGSARRLLRAAVSDGRVLATVVGKNGNESTREIPAAPPELAAWITKPARTNPAPLPPLPPLTSTTETQRVVLESGLVVVAHSSPDSRTFAAHLLMKDRARWESALGVPRGASDVLHRMLANGTARLDAHELRGLLASYGASVKVTDAAGLPYDDYYFTPEYSYVRIESFDLFGFAALELLGEIVRQPAFTSENLAQALESAIARAEEDAGSPRFVAEARFHADAPDLAGAVHGPAEELRKLDLASARRLHDALTAPSNMILTVSSNLPAHAVIEGARRAFGKARGEEKPLAARAVRRAAATERRTESPTGRDQSWIVVGRPLDVAGGDEPALRLATAVLSERLAERLREKEGLAYSIGASMRVAKPDAWVSMAAGTRAQNLEAMERGMMEVAASLRSNPPSAEEAEGAMNRSEGRERMRRLSRMGIAYALAIAELRGRDPVALDADARALRAVTPADVARAASLYLTFESPWVSIAR